MLRGRSDLVPPGAPVVGTCVSGAGSEPVPCEPANLRPRLEVRVDGGGFRRWSWRPSRQTQPSRSGKARVAVRELETAGRAACSGDPRLAEGTHAGGAEAVCPREWRHDCTYRRPSRRTGVAGPVVLSSLAAHRSEVAVVVDTSRSMREEDVALALGEVEAFLRANGRQLATVYAVDTKVQAVSRAADVRQVRLAGRGGTIMAERIYGLPSAADRAPVWLLCLPMAAPDSRLTRRQSRYLWGSSVAMDAVLAASPPGLIPSW